MKVFVIYKSADENAGPAGAYSYPMAVVLDDTGVKSPYSAKEFTLISSKEQPRAMKAWDEVSKLSDEARGQLGLTFDKLAALQKKAEGGNVALKPGATVYASLYSGEDGMAPARVTGVYAWKREDDPFERPEALKVSRTLADHLGGEKRAKVKKEVSGVSAETLRYLEGLK